MKMKTKMNPMIKSLRDAGIQVSDVAEALRLSPATVRTHLRDGREGVVKDYVEHTLGRITLEDAGAEEYLPSLPTLPPSSPPSSPSPCNHACKQGDDEQLEIGFGLVDAVREYRIAKNPDETDVLQKLHEVEWHEVVFVHNIIKQTGAYPPSIPGKPYRSW